MSGQHTQWWLQGEIIAYASSKEGRANCVISKAQYDNALPKNRTEYDVPLAIAGQLGVDSQLAAARALLAGILAEAEGWHDECRGAPLDSGIADEVRAFLKGGNDA